MLGDHELTNMTVVETSPSSQTACGSQPLHRASSVGSALIRHGTLNDELSLASIDRPPSIKEGLPPSKIYHPLSLHVLALLIPASILGLLARLGLEALGTYDGQSIFPLAYVQSIGCFIMGFGVALKEPLGRLYVARFFQFVSTTAIADCASQLWTAIHGPDHRCIYSFFYSPFH